MAPSLLSPIKTEPTNETSPNLYRFSPSPAPSIRYHTFHSDLRSPSTSSFDNERHPPFNSGASNANFHTPSSPSVPYHGASNGNSLPSSYSDGGGGSYHSDDSNAFNSNLEYNNATNRSSSHAFCACRTSPALGITYISLAHQVQSALGALRQYSNHTPNTQCMLYRRILELDSLMQYVFIIPYPGLLEPDVTRFQRERTSGCWCGFVRKRYLGPRDSGPFVSNVSI